MSRWGVSLVAVFILVLAGCRSGGEKKPSDDKFTGPDRTGETTGRGGSGGGAPANPDTPAHWLDRPKPNWMHGSTPPAATWKDPKSPDFNPKTDSAGLLAGYVEDPEGRKVPNVYIEVRESGDTSGKPIGVLSGTSGAFNADGLKPGKNYQLTVNAAVDGRKMFQTVYVKAPNPNVRLSLLEVDGSVPAPHPAKPGDPPASADPLYKPPTGSIPNPNTDGPIPKPNFGMGDRDPGVAPVGGYEPPAPRDDALPKGERFDLMTDQGPVPWKPPVASIPTPRTGRPVPSATPPARGESRKQTFGFVDHTGKDVPPPSGKAVLMAFHTAGSMASVRAVPVLNGLYEKYADRGLTVVSVGCEDEPLSARLMAADLFRKDHAVKYPVLTESSRVSGDALKRYGVSELPSAVLLNEKGEVIWQGNPNKPTGLTEAIEAAVK